MKLWGKVVGGALLFIAAVFASVAIAIPEARTAAFIAAAIAGGTGWLGIPALVRLFTSLTGDSELLVRGTHATATLLRIASTGWRYNRAYPILRLTLSVNLSGTVYETTIRQALPPQRASELSPGMTLDVRVDPADRRKVMIEWNRPGQ